MRKQYELIPIGYSNRPAFLLLIGCVIGVLLFYANWLLWGTLSLCVISTITIILLRKYASLEPVLWVSIIAIFFGTYSSIRSQEWEILPHGSTINEAPIRVNYPVANSAESAIKYHAQVQIKDNRWVTILLSTPEELPKEVAFGSEGVCTLDLSRLELHTDRKYDKYLISEGYVAEGYLQKVTNLTPLSRPPMMSIFHRFRSDIEQNFEKICRGYLPWSRLGLIYALSLGDRSLLPQATKDQFSTSGVSHILAVSGYHLGVVFALVSLIFNRLIWRYEYRKWRYLLIFLSLLIYTLLTGTSTPTLRALVMISVALIAKSLNRPIDPIQLLSLTMLFFLLYNPFAYYSIGLLLSIGAVWGIFSFLPIFRSLIHPCAKWSRWITNVVSVTLSAQIGIFPLLFIFFGSSTIGFIWSNIPIVLISSLLIPFALICLIFAMIFGWLPNIFITILNALVSMMEGVTSFFSEESIQVSIPFDGMALIAYYAIAFCLYRWLYLRTESIICAREDKH